MAFSWPATLQPNLDDPHVGHSRLGKLYTTQSPAASWIVSPSSRIKSSPNPSGHRHCEEEELAVFTLTFVLDPDKLIPHPLLFPRSLIGSRHRLALPE